jgi:3',5'-cyclic AMP phosphodiesterase CpdA
LARAAAGVEKTAGAGAASADGVLRVAHLTDVHVQPERGGGRGMAACLRHIQEHGKPSFILNTGDCVMDSFKHDKARTDLVWELWGKVLKDECSLPIEHTIGNHDIWGWNKKASGTSGQEVLWGKKRALDALGIAKTYHSFDRGAWHFVMLDSMMPYEDSYRAKLDDEQFEWLKADLKAVPKDRPVLVASHIPILSASSVVRTAHPDPAVPGEMVVAGGAMHMDVRRLWALFSHHPNVKLCVSGHLHHIDRADFMGVTYATNPAVCGAWWKGKLLDRWGQMYTMLELRPDGTFDIEHVDYGWKIEPEPAKAT